VTVLGDRVEVAPALGEAAVAPEGRAAARPVHQIHRLARAVGGVDRSEAAAGALFEHRLLTGSDGVPQLRNHCRAIGAPGIEDRIGPAVRAPTELGGQRTFAALDRSAGGST
jgi:hypothetical protein